MYGNYNRLHCMKKNGEAYFSMVLSKTALPYETESNVFFCTGNVPEYNRGYPLTLYGTWQKSSEGQWTFVTESYEEDLKNGRVLQEFLVKNISGVGEVSAKKIALLGAELWNIIKKENAADELSSQSGISKKICETVVCILQKNECRYELYCLLCKYGISDIKVNQLVQKYGTSALTLTKKDPYRVLSGMDIPFSSMDEIGFSEGMSHYSDSRLEAILTLALKKNTADGSTYADFNKVMDEIGRISKQSIFRKKIPVLKVAAFLKKSKKFYLETLTNRLFFREIYEAEKNIAKNTARLIQTLHPFHWNESDIDFAEKANGVFYSKNQREAFHILDGSGIKVLTGGPGTGKTTLLNGILNVFFKNNPSKSVALCAPTGMAAEHMAESTGYPASTIHKLLDYQPFEPNASNEILPKAKHKTAIDADFIVVDEASMMDVVLADMLLAAVQSGSSVLLCGDADQLDSVGEGAVLGDFIASGKIPVFHLTELFRQTEKSEIVKNALRIKNGEKTFFAEKDFRIVRYDENSDIKELLREELFSHKKPHPELFEKIQILSTTKRGEAGTPFLNSFIQEQLFFQEGRTIQRNGYIFHSGDKIVMTKNNYKAGYFNGDIGKIKSISESGQMTITTHQKTILMEHDWIEEIVPAYALTVHKSQGSEFEHVIVVLPQKPSVLLGRSLLYTAVTRAKKTVTIFSQKDALETAVKKNNKAGRRTCLSEYLSAKE